MQRYRWRVDGLSANVRVLSLWLLSGGVLIAGYCVGLSMLPQVELSILSAIPTGVGLCIVVAGWMAVRARAGRCVRGPLALVLLLVCAVRGVVGGAHDAAPRDLTTAQRGPAHGLVSLVAVGASMPGAKCRVRVRGAGSSFDLLAPPEACPLAEGDRILVLATDLAPVVAPLTTMPPRVTTERVFTDRGSAASGAPYWHALASARQWAWDMSRGEPGRAFVAASALGLVSALPSDVRSDVRRAGIGHLIAISGMHIGFLGLLVQRTLQRLFGPLGLRPGAAIAVSWIPIVAYVVATGAAAPAIRAAVMLAVAGSGSMLGRPTHGVTVLAMAAVGMLVVAPSWASDPGFHLSVAAMAAVVRLPPSAGLLEITWQLQWAVLPVSLVHFGAPGAGALLANVLAIPIFTTWVMPLALIGALAIPFAGAAALDPAAAGAELLLDVADAVAGWPVVPGWLLAALAAIAIATRLATARDPSAPGRGGRWARLREGLVPPLAAAIGVLAALGAITLGAASRPAGPSLRWVAIGTPTAPTVVAISASGQAACVRDPGGDPRRWAARLDALGVSRVDAVIWTGRQAESGADPPHIAALRAELRRAGRLAPVHASGAGTCAFPARAEVTRALSTCARVQPRGTAAAAVGQGASWCWQRGNWQPVQLDYAARSDGP